MTWPIPNPGVQTPPWNSLDPPSPSCVFGQGNFLVKKESGKNFLPSVEGRLDRNFLIGNRTLMAGRKQFERLKEEVEDLGVFEGTVKNESGRKLDKLLSVLPLFKECAFQFKKRRERDQNCSNGSGSWKTEHVEAKLRDFQVYFPKRASLPPSNGFSVD